MRVNRWSASSVDRCTHIGTMIPSCPSVRCGDPRWGRSHRTRGDRRHSVAGSSLSAKRRLFCGCAAGSPLVAPAPATIGYRINRHKYEDA
jgi:Fe-S oxidoreductase